MKIDAFKQIDEITGSNLSRVNDLDVGDPLFKAPLKEENGDIVEIAKEWELGERYPVTLLLDSSTIPLDPVEIEAEAQIYLNTDLPRSSKITGRTVTFFKAGEFKEPDLR